MRTVRFRLTAADSWLAGTPLVVAVHPAGEPPRTPIVTHVDEILSTRQEGDQCGFAVLLPSGGTVTTAVAAGAHDDRVEVDLAPYGDAHLLFTTAGRRVWGSFHDPGHRDCWIRLWRAGESGGWAVAPWPAEPISRGADRITFRLRLPSGRHMVQTGGSGLVPRLSVLPGADRVEVTVRPAAGPVPGLATFVVTADASGEALRGYLSCGALSAARQIDQLSPAGFGAARTTAWVTRGYLRLRAVPEWVSVDPGVAPDAEYRLLTPGRNAEAVDEAVIQGWMWLQGGARTDPRAAGRAFERAVTAGVPVYPDGLRLLATGLRRLADPPSAGLLARLAPFLEAADPSEPTTAFTGVAPDAPSVTATDDECAALPYPYLLGPGGVDPGGMGPVAAQRLEIAYEILADLEEWWLSAEAWDQVGTLVDQARTALLAAQVEEFLDRIERIGDHAPARTVAGVPAPAPAPVRTAVGELVELMRGSGVVPPP